MKGIHLHNNEKLDQSILDQLRNDEIQYVILHDFISGSDLTQIKKDLKNIPQELLITPAKDYFVFPRTSFNTIDINEDPSIYFNGTENDLSNIISHFKTNLSEKFSRTFRNLNNNKCKILHGPNGTFFNPFNFRVMNQKVGVNATANIHNGSSITSRCEKGTYNHLIQDINFDNQLSFFTIIENSKKGGEISIYNYKRKEFPKLIESKILINNKNEEIDLLKTTNKIKLKIEDGDLLLFPGGQYWHRVEPVTEGSRISLGGFLASDFETKNWYYWV